MKIHCLFDEMKDVHTLTPHPKNPNKHPQEQIDRLAKILEYQGFRYPIKISKQSGYITSGHGRLMAAKKMGMTTVPVVYQDYESTDQELADLTADNAVALWAELDFSSINSFIPDFDPSFDIELLGMENFKLDPVEKETKDSSKELNLDDFDNFQHTCPKCSFGWNDV